MHRNRLKFGLLLALTATLCAAQQGSVQREGNAWSSVTQGSLAAGHNLHIQLEGGGIEVEGGSSQGISYIAHNRTYEPSEERGRRQLEGFKINAYTRGDTTFIVGEWEGGRPHRLSSDVKVMVPRDMELVKVETGGGPITVRGITGRVEGQSAGGPVHLDDIGGSVNVETGGQQIDIGSVGGEVKVRTGGGVIHIGSAKGRVVAETGGGNIMLASCAQGADLQTGAGTIKVEKCVGEVKAETSGGNIELGDVSGEANIQTGGGTIKLMSAKGSVKAETGGGCIELWGVPSARVETGVGTITAKFIPGGNSDSELETGMGDITLYLAANLHATIQASIEAASGHTITSEFSEIKVSSEGGERWGPKMVSAEGALNGGGPVLKVRTTMGNIYIKRAQ